MFRALAPQYQPKFALVTLIVGLIASLLFFSQAPAGHSATGYIYWTNQVTDSIGRVDLDGSNNTTLLTGRTDPSAITNDGEYLYWTEQGKIFKAPITDPTTITQIATDAGTFPSYGISVFGDYVYWTEDQTKVNRVTKSGTGVTTLITDVARVFFGIAVNDSHLYIADYTDDDIYRANLDGSNYARLITGANNNGVSGIAVDGTYLYYSNINDATIGRALLNGSSADETWLPAAQPYSVAVTSQYIYWPTYSATPGIYRADIDGTNTRTLLTMPTGVSGITIVGGETAVTEDPLNAPPPVLQQLPRMGDGTCDIQTTEYDWSGVDSGGWSESWAEWAVPITGGAICTRTLRYASGTGRWVIAT